MKLSDEQINGLRTVFLNEIWADTKAKKQINALCDAALAHNAAKRQEPVAWVNLKAWKSGSFWPDDCFSENELETVNTPLYTSPPDLAEARELLESAWPHLSNAYDDSAIIKNKINDFLERTK